MTNAHAVGCDIWQGGECSCRNRDPTIFGGPDIEEEAAQLQAEIERLRAEAIANARAFGKLHNIIGAHEAEIERLNEGWEKANSELLAERLANTGKVHPCDDSTAANLASALADNERLREENKTFRAAQKACEHCDAPTVAEIERLRERVTTQEELLEFKRVEITKLRGLLNEFWECADADTEYWDLQGGYHKELRQRVRKALGE